MASRNWYYAVDNERKGPVEETELSNLVTGGTIGPKTLIWSEGMTDWAAAETALPENLRAFDGKPQGGPESAIPPLTPSVSPPGDKTADFKEAVRTCFNKYATFSGRARRPEFWYFALFTFLANLALSFVDGLLFGMDGFSPLGTLFSLAVVIPSLAVGARRLHDIGRTGWWLLLSFVPVIGFIVLIIFFATKSEEEANEYGPA